MLSKLLTAAAVVALLAGGPVLAQGYDKDKRLFEGPTFSPADQLLILAAGDNVAPGSGNWGGGRGNSGPGDKNGQNDKSKDGGQTPNDDK